MKHTYIIATVVLFSLFILAGAELVGYEIDGDTVYFDDGNIYLDATPHTIYGDGWVSSNLILKNYDGDINIAYGFDDSTCPTTAEFDDPHPVPYITSHRAWFYNVSSIVQTTDAPYFGNEYNNFKRKITYQRCVSSDQLSGSCTEYVDETVVVAFDSYDIDGINYTAHWDTQETRIEDYRDISDRFQFIEYDYDGKNEWYYVTDVPIETGKLCTVRTYIKVLNSKGSKYDIAVWPSFYGNDIGAAIAAGHFYLLDPWAEVSELNFTSPTPANESTIYLNQTTINVSIATSDLTYFTFNWNGTNATYTTAGTEWNQSADSYVRSTTVGSYTQPDFDNIFPWSHMRRCTLWDNGTVNYYLNATNSSVKATGGLSDLSGADGQVMVEIPKFYYNHDFVGSEHNWEISRFNISGFSVHNAFIKNGVTVNYRYMAAYEGSMWDASESAMVPSVNIINNMYAAGDKLCSVSGEYPKVNEIRSEYRSMAAQRGTGWRQQDFDLISAVQLLYLVEYADFDSQSTIGYGRTQLSGGTWTADSYIGQCGKSNGDGDGTNSVAGNTNNAYMTYRGIENFYGNVWTWVDGININTNILYVTNTDSDWADDTSTNYTNLCVTLSNVNGYQVTLADTDRGFLPASVGGSSSTYICDYYWQNTGWRVVLLGGGALSGAYAGAFYVLASDAASHYDVHIGGRLAY